MDRKGNFGKSIVFCFGDFMHSSGEKKLRSNIMLQLRFIRLFLLSYYHIALCLAFTIFQISNLRSTIKIQLCHRHYKLIWSFPYMFIDVPWIFLYIWLAAHTTLLFFALYTSALYILQGVLCDRERSISCYFFCHYVEFGKKDENQERKYKQEYLYLWTK
jgi:hypothetical protein